MLAALSSSEMHRHPVGKVFHLLTSHHQKDCSVDYLIRIFITLLKRTNFFAKVLEASRVWL